LILEEHENAAELSEVAVGALLARRRQRRSAEPGAAREGSARQ